MFLTQSGIIASVFSVPPWVGGTTIIPCLIMYSIPFANVLSSIWPSAHHAALFFTHSGIVTVCDGVFMIVLGGAVEIPTSNICEDFKNVS